VEDVGEEEGAEVPDVRGRVDGGTAEIDPRPSLVERNELLVPPGERVVKRSMPRGPGTGDREQPDGEVEGKR
jgi:hypothetical protein